MNQDIRQTGMLSEDFGRVMENLNAAVAVVGLDGNLSEWNRVATQLTGYSKKEVIGNSMAELMIVRDYQPAAITVIERGLRGIESSGFECEVIRRDERLVFFWLTPP